MTGWRWASASVRGESHARKGEKKQDAIRAFSVGTAGDRLCLILSDGAGSAKFGGPGAAITCRVMSARLRSHFSMTQDFPEAETILDWIDEVRDTIALYAAARDLTLRDFACTMILCGATDSGTFCAHIGDGAVVGRQIGSASWRVISAPENGEYASTTFFVTDDPEPSLRLTYVPHTYASIVAFTDGIETVALDLATMTPHPPFFESMTRPLDGLSGFGKSTELSSKLAAFLVSDRLAARTDDDRTLVVSRR